MQLKMATKKESASSQSTDIEEVWYLAQATLNDTKDDDETSMSSLSTEISNDSAFTEKNESDNEESDIFTLQSPSSQYQQKRREAELSKEKLHFVRTSYLNTAVTEGVKGHIIITGLPGSGKSCLAIKCAERLMERLDIANPPKIVKTLSTLDYKGVQLLLIDGPFDQISLENHNHLLKIVRFINATSISSRVITVFQSEVLNLLRIQNQEHGIFQRFTIIDISAEPFNVEESKRLFISHNRPRANEKGLEEFVTEVQKFPSFPKCCEEFSSYDSISEDDFRNVSINVIQNHFQSMELACKVLLCGVCLKNDRLLYKDIQQTSKFKNFMEAISDLLGEPFTRFPNQILNDIAKAFKGPYLEYNEEEMAFEFVNSITSDAAHRMVFSINMWRYIEICPVQRLVKLSNDTWYRSKLKGNILVWLIERIVTEINREPSKNNLKLLWDLLSWVDGKQAIKRVSSSVLEFDKTTQAMFFEMPHEKKCMPFFSSMLLKIPELKYDRLVKQWGFGNSHGNLFYYNELCPCLCQLYNMYSRSRYFSRLHFLENFIEKARLDKHSKIGNGLMYESRHQVLVYDILDPGVRIRNRHESTSFDKVCSEDKTKMKNVPTKESMLLLNVCVNKPEQYCDALISVGEERKQEWCIKCAILYGSLDWRRKICSEFPYQSQNFSTKIIVEEIKKLYVRFYSDNLRILNAYCGCNSENVHGIDTMVMVVSDEKESIGIDRNPDIAGLRVLIRKKDEVSDEAERVLPYEEKGPRLPFTMPTSKSVGHLFRNHSNITLVNMSSVRSTGYGDGKIKIERSSCVVIHCQIKGVVPFGENPFPKDIDGYPVDVREATCKFAVDPLRIGMEITNNEKTMSGTLGGFVDMTGDFNKLFLTCAHVICPVEILVRGDSRRLGTRRELHVFDRQQCNENIGIGVVEKVAFSPDNPDVVSVDAALVGITGRHPVDGHFASVYKTEQMRRAGFSENNTPSFQHGQIEALSDSNFRNEILKVGAKTGLTIGSLKYENSSARLLDKDVPVGNNFRFTFYKQLEVMPKVDSSLPSDTKQLFLDEGDSGALVFIIKNSNPAVLKCIGMAIACTSYGSGIVTPIESIFQALQIPQNCLSKFEAQIEEHSEMESILRAIRSGFSDVSERIRKVESDLSSSTSALGDKIEHVSERLANFEERLSSTENAVGNISKDLSQRNQTN